MDGTGHPSAFSKNGTSETRLPIETGKHTTGENQPRFGAFTGSRHPPSSPVGPDFGSNRPSNMLRMWRLHIVMSVRSRMSMLRDEAKKCRSTGQGAFLGFIFSVPAKPHNRAETDRRHRERIKNVVIHFHTNSIAAILNPGSLGIGNSRIAERALWRFCGWCYRPAPSGAEVPPAWC